MRSRLLNEKFLFLTYVISCRIIKQSVVICWRLEITDVTSLMLNVTPPALSEPHLKNLTLCCGLLTLAMSPGPAGLPGGLGLRWGGGKEILGDSPLPPLPGPM